MRRVWMFLGVGVLLAAGLILGHAGWKVYRNRTAQVCALCNRPVHPETRVVGLMGNHRAALCCPACALTAQQQTGAALRLISLTDYETRAELETHRAYIAENSDVNHCAHAAALLDEFKTPHQVRYDRCSPSYIAFGRREAAERFVAEHGGRLLRFSELYTTPRP